MKSHKSPASNSFQPFFFQKYWHLVGHYVHNLVQRAFQTGVFDNHINHTLLVLMPKTDHPECLKQFRHIALCNVIYKTISKVLVNRLKRIMDKLIPPPQASFVPGKQAAYNIIIAQEMVDSIKKSKATNGGLMLKLDLERAYDKVDWDFLNQTFQMFNFPQTIIKLINTCINSVRVIVLSNGEKTDSFSTSRGLRQGDPLLPFLFVICLERLSILINKSRFG